VIGPLYIRIRRGTVKSQRAIDKDVILDIDKDNKILGIEVLSAHELEINGQKAEIEEEAP